MLSIHSPSLFENKSIASNVEAAERVRPGETALAEETNLALAPEEIATLASLMSRYDDLLVEMDNLNLRLEELLKVESPPQTVER